MERGSFATPTGQPCPRCLREDGSVDGSGACHGCGCCLLLLEAAWPDHAAVFEPVDEDLESAR